MSNFLRKPEFMIEKGVNFSVPSVYLGDGYNYPQNFQLVKGEMKKRDGRTAFGGTTLGAEKVLHLGIFELMNGGIRLIRHTRKNVQKYNTTSRAFDDITGPVDLTGSDIDFFDDAVVTESDLYLFTNNKVDVIKKYDDSGNIETLGGTPPRCSTIEYVTPYVLIADLIDGGNTYSSKIQWCDTGTPEVWSGGNSGSQLLSDDASGIRKIKKLSDQIFAYKEKSVYRGRKVSTDSIFDFGGPFSSGKGIYSARAIADDGQSHYYMGLNDFHINNGVRISDIGGPIREYIFNRLNRTRANTCHAVFVEQYKEVWFYITIGGFDWPTEVWKYNYDLGFWYFDTVNNCITANNYKQTSTRSWNDMVGTWNNQTTFWDDQSGLTDAPIGVFGDSYGQTQKIDPFSATDSGVAIDSKIESKDYSGITHKGIEYDTRFLQFDVYARGRGNLKVSYSLDYGASWAFIDSLPIPTTTEKMTFWFDVIAKHIRFKLEMSGINDVGTIRSFTPYFLGDAEEV